MKMVFVSQIRDFIKSFIVLFILKPVFFSRRCLRHSHLFSKFYDSFTFEFYPFRNFFDNLLTILRNFIEFENRK